jgi:hypothetical protein
MSSARHTYKENPYQPRIIEEKKSENVAGALSSISHNIKSVNEKIISASKETSREICDIKKMLDVSVTKPDIADIMKEINNTVSGLKQELLNRLDKIDGELNGLKSKLAEFDVVEELPLPSNEDRNENANENVETEIKDEDDEIEEEEEDEDEIEGEVPKDWVSDDDAE